MQAAGHGERSEEWLERVTAPRAVLNYPLHSRLFASPQWGRGLLNLKSYFRHARTEAVSVAAAAVKAHEPARAAVADPERTEKYRRGMVRTAILLARPVEP